MEGCPRDLVRSEVNSVQVGVWKRGRRGGSEGSLDPFPDTIPCRSGPWDSELVNCRTPDSTGVGRAGGGGVGVRDGRDPGNRDSGVVDSRPFPLSPPGLH